MRVVGMPDLIVFVGPEAGRAVAVGLLDQLRALESVACLELVPPSRGAREFRDAVGIPVPPGELPWTLKVAFEPGMDRRQRLHAGRAAASVARGVAGVIGADVGPALVPPDGWAPPRCVPAGRGPTSAEAGQGDGEDPSP